MGYLKPFNPLLNMPGWHKPNKPRLEAMWLNNTTFMDYYYRIEEIAINMFEWANLPDSVDERFIELILCEYGYGVYFDDPVLGNLFLTCMTMEPLDVYRYPTKRRAYSVNDYQKELTNKDSVLVYNNYLHTNTLTTIILYARRLADIERSIEVNIRAQKTPVLVTCEEAQQLTMKNAYKDYDGNMPVIFANTGIVDPRSIQSIQTQAPFVADKLMIIKRQIWNEMLTFFGVENGNSEKKERLITDEVMSNLGSVQAQRYIMLNSRRKAADQINKMFGTNIEVNFRQDFSALNTEMPTTTTMSTGSRENIESRQVENPNNATLF